MWLYKIVFARTEIKLKNNFHIDKNQNQAVAENWKGKALSEFRWHKSDNLPW